MAWGDYWGVAPDEELLSFPVDLVLPEANAAWYRGITVESPVHTLFRWLCQLRMAPYSYDWIDNRGKTSPREFTPGLDELAVGQRVMSVFELVSFEHGRHLTLLLKRTSGFPPVALSYIVVPDDDETTRLLVKVLVHYEGLRGLLFRPWFARADLFMMKKQLETLKTLAER
jgi:hypothetical protein